MNVFTLELQINQAYVGICLKLRLHDAIYRLRFYSNSLIHILSLSNSPNNLAFIQKNRGDKSHRVVVAKHIIPVVTRLTRDLKQQDAVKKTRRPCY